MRVAAVGKELRGTLVLSRLGAVVPMKLPRRQQPVYNPDTSGTNMA